MLMEDCRDAFFALFGRHSPNVLEINRPVKGLGCPEESRDNGRAEPMADNLDITQLLNAAADGMPGAADRLLPVVYEELRCLARRRFPGSTPTLGPTAFWFTKRGCACQRDQHGITAATSSVPQRKPCDASSSNMHGPAAHRSAAVAWLLCHSTSWVWSRPMPTTPGPRCGAGRN